jgi:hypothetical protein
MGTKSEKKTLLKLTEINFWRCLKLAGPNQLWEERMGEACERKHSFSMLVFWAVMPYGLVGRYINVSEEHTASIFRAKRCVPKLIRRQKLHCTDPGISFS